ncbi:hypothetical protein K474DRAFT_984585 [Panus rudis PR-1116 ss-1]|nr:hypothetical protein K474DRAFT_984585 [Panus rudis PR-1116 ss-1]
MCYRRVRETGILVLFPSARTRACPVSHRVGFSFSGSYHDVGRPTMGSWRCGMCDRVSTYYQPQYQSLPCLKSS